MIVTTSVMALIIAPDKHNVLNQRSFDKDMFPQRILQDMEKNARGSSIQDIASTSIVLNQIITRTTYKHGGPFKPYTNTTRSRSLYETDGSSLLSKPLRETVPGWNRGGGPSKIRTVHDRP
jgi:hypothetical protein